MRSLAIGCISAITLGIAAASAQSSNGASPAATPAATPAAVATPDSASNVAFIDKQEVGLIRAPKLVGVVVYDSENKSVGKIDDILLDHSGQVKAVVVGIGGFLGIGKKDVALPYDAVHWQTEQRSVATNEPPSNSLGHTGSTGANDVTAPAGQTQTKTIDPAATEAYQGYPDRAVLNVTQAELKSAPEFKYASNPSATSAPGPAPSALSPTPAQKP